MTEVARQINHLDARILVSPRRDLLQGRILAAVIDQHNLCLALHLGHELFENSGEDEAPPIPRCTWEERE